jgi:hypothetical protein
MHIAKDKGVLIFVGRDKDKWNFVNNGKSGTLRITNTTIGLLLIPIRPVETENQREESKRRQDREDLLFTSANGRWVKDTKTSIYQYTRIYKNSAC